MPGTTAGVVAGEVGFIGFQLIGGGFTEIVSTILAYSAARLVWYFFGDKMKVYITKIKSYIINKIVKKRE